MKPLFIAKIFLLGILAAHSSFADAQTIDTLRSNADAHVYSGSVGTNYGSDTAIPIYVSGSGYYRYYLNFNIASLSIPSNAIISAAELYLTVNSTGEGGAGTSVYVLEQVTSSWAENTIAFNAQPSSSSVKQVTFSSTISGVRSWKVKNIVQGIVDGSTTNYGFLIHRANEVSTTAASGYHSREVVNATLRPMLIIKWYLPLTFSSVSITHASDSTATDGAITSSISGGSGSFTYQWYDLNDDSGTDLSGETSLSLSGVGRGVYGLEVTGDWGDSHYMAFIVGVSCDATEVSFYPWSDFMDDAYISASSPTTPGGTSNNFQASGASSTRSLTLSRFLLWFDPSLYTQSANLHLTGKNHANPGPVPNDAEFWLISSAWNESTVVYTTEPTSSSTITVDVPPTSGSTMNGVFNIAEYCNYWTNHTNYGMAFKLDGAGYSSARQQYHSSDASTASNRPYIVFRVFDVGCDQTSYTTFKREQDAGYVITFDGTLKVHFVEPYMQETGKKIPLKLYDQNHTLVAGINYDGAAIGAAPLLPSLDYKSDDNRHILDLSTYSLTNGNYYLLELTRSSGEHEYIRFMYSN